MQQLRTFIWLLWFAPLLITSCAMFEHGDDPNYTLCKSLEGKIQFGGNTSYSPEAQSADVDKRRLQATYDKLNCSKYQWLKF